MELLGQKSHLDFDVEDPNLRQALGIFNLFFGEGCHRSKHQRAENLRVLVSGCKKNHRVLREYQIEKAAL